MPVIVVPSGETVTKETVGGLSSAAAAKRTLTLGRNPVPEIVKSVPPREEAVAGENVAIDGVVPLKLKWLGSATPSAPSCPSGLTTTTLVGPTMPAGVVARMLVGPSTDTGRAGVSPGSEPSTADPSAGPKKTEAPGWKSVPAITTSVPPLTDPVEGDTLVTFGAGT